MRKEVSCALLVPFLLVVLLLPSAEGSADTDKVRAALLKSLRHPFDASTATNALIWANSLLATRQWSDLSYTAGCAAKRSPWPARYHLTRITYMTKAYSSPESPLYQNSTLLDKIVLGLTYWFDNDYTNEACTNRLSAVDCPCSTPGLWNDNWWWNMIGVQLELGPTCLLLADSAPSASFTSAMRSTCGRILRRSNWQGFTGANTLWLAKSIVFAGLLMGNDAEVARAYRASNQELFYSLASNDGIKADGSFFQHKGIIYNGGYGASFLSTFNEMLSAAVGTSFMPNEAEKGVYSRFVLDGSQWMAWSSRASRGGFNKNLFDPSVCGRQISSAGGGVNFGARTIRELTVGWPRAKEFEQMGRNIANYDWTSVTGNRMFWHGDYMVHRRSNYFVSIKGVSNRILNSECVNAENLQGLHLSDGAMYLHQSGDEYYRINGTNQSVFPLWDYYHIPGITVDYGVNRLTCNTSTTTGRREFVGGASDGTYGVFAMDFESPSSSRNLLFKKAWFLFDQAIVVMATNISSVNNASAQVHSVLDSKVLSPGGVYSSIKGRATPVATGDATSVEVSNPWWLHHDSVGYIFPQNLNSQDGSTPVSLNLQTGLRTGSWADIGVGTGSVSLPMFTAWLTKQKAPVRKDSLVYVVVPQVSLARFDPQATLDSLVMLANTAQVQAVYERKAGLVGAVFWQATNVRLNLARLLGDESWGELSVSDPCVLLVRKGPNDQLRLTASDPTQKLSKLKVTLTRRPQCLSGCAKTATSSVTGELVSSAVEIALESGTGASTTIDMLDAELSSASQLFPYWWRILSSFLL